MIDFNDTRPLTREVCEIYGFTIYEKLDYCNAVIYANNHKGKPWITVLLPSGEITASNGYLGLCNAGQFAALMFALGIGPKGSDNNG